jgi:hypothetical protein
MGCGMTVPNAVPPSERPSVENHPIVPWNVPPFRWRQSAQSMQQFAMFHWNDQRPECIVFCTQFRAVPFHLPPREWNGGTLARAHSH